VRGFSRGRLVLASFVAAAQLGTAHAEQKPLWELGAGATVFSLPYYRGADHNRTYVYPFPYVVYRGERLRVDRQGIRALLFDSDRVEFDISGYATPPVKSDRSTVRQGMPDLDATVEVGPAINWTLARARTLDARLDLRLPVRAVFATDLGHVQSAGFVFYPHLNLDLHPAALDGRWNIGLQAGPLFASHRYHQYYYSVPSQFATPSRPAFEAGGGYSGTVLLASMSRRFRQFWMGAFVRYDTLRNAAFEASPLVQRDHSLAAGVGFAWVFAESSERVESPD
jgi:outer membrane protein